MNYPQSRHLARALPAEADPGEELDLLRLLGTLVDARWLIACTTVLALLAGGAYAFLSPPVYEANTLIQVEENAPGAEAALVDAASLFDVRSPASAEMEILRSRMVVGGAVDTLGLHITAAPRYVPVIGAWLARRADGLSQPGFLGLPGYVSGTESIRIDALALPDFLQRRPLTLTASGEAGWQLAAEDGRPLVQGRVGVPVEFTVDGRPARILVGSLQGRPGAQFDVMQRSRLSVIQSLQARLAIAEKGRQSGVIAISLQGTDPGEISRILRTIGDRYVSQNVERKAAEAEKTLAFLDRFLPELKRRLESSESSYNRFRNQAGTFDLGNEGRLALDRSAQIEARLMELQQRRRELASRFTDQHPEMRVIDGQIGAIRRELAELAGRVRALPSVEQELLRLTREMKVNAELYTSLLNSAQQLQLVKEGKVGNVRVVDAAVTAPQPVKPRKSLILALGLVLGLMAGVALAVLRNMLRPAIRDAADIEGGCGIPVFATVPHSVAQERLDDRIRARAPGRHLLAHLHPDDACVESLRSLRTALQFALLDARNNIVMITGPAPGLGKSFTSVNFAAVMGLGGKRVLLVDADLRRGHVHQYFGIERGPGLSELVTGEGRLEAVLHRQVSEGVDLLTTGTLPPNPGELLLSPAMGALLQQLSGQYDLVLVDTPPVLPVSDAQALGVQVGAVFFVVRADLSTVGELQEAAARLAQAGVPVNGAILNDLDLRKHRYRYGGRYRYRYGYRHYDYLPGRERTSQGA